jgi:hypothetical protein
MDFQLKHEQVIQEKVFWAMDRGMTSEENRRNLQRAGGQHILDEKLKGTNINEEALNRGGRFISYQGKPHY